MSQNESGLGRRDALKRIGLTAVLVGPGMSILNACATSGSDDKPKDEVKANNADAKNPFGVKADGPLNVVIFKGGFDESYATQVHEVAYKVAFPQAKIKHEPIVTIGKSLQPRFSAGKDVPEVVDNSGADMMDVGALVQGGALADLTPLWDAPSIDDPNVKVRDTVFPGTIESGVLSGKPYLMNYTSTTFGLWYNAKLFAANGWTAPKTFDEFKQLCEKIKAKGIIPYAYAGKNAAYYQWTALIISAAKIGGNQVLVDIDNLTPASWNNDSVKAAATAWAEIGAKYSDKSFEGLIHTEIQTRQNKDKIAFYPSGSWLENEQKKSTPASFEYALAPNPSVTAADKLPYEAVRVAPGEAFFVSEKALNRAGGLEYLRIMLSKAGAKGFFEKTGSFASVKGSLEGATLSPGATSVVAAQKAAGDANVVTYSNFDSWYKPLGDEAFKQVNALMFGRITADQFCANMQKAADKIKNDSNVDKQARS